MKKSGSYLHTSLSPSWTHSQAGRCSCSSQVCSGTDHCHIAVCLPGTHQCLKATVRRQETHRVKRTVQCSKCFNFVIWFSSSSHTLLCLFVPKAHSMTVSKIHFTQMEWSGAYFFFSFIFISWRLITLQYYSGFCHTLTWISHGFTCIPHLDLPSHLPLHLIPLGLPSAPGPSTCLMHPAWAGDLFHPR